MKLKHLLYFTFFLLTYPAPAAAGYQPDERGTFGEADDDGVHKDESPPAEDTTDSTKSELMEIRN